MSDKLNWLFTLNIENQNIMTITVLLRGRWYMWNIKRPLSVSRWFDE